MNILAKVFKRKNKEEPIYKQIIGYIVSMLCILLCLYITIEVIVANTENRPPRVFGLSTSYVPTESMEPTISKNSYIMFSYATFDSVDEGDIIVYHNDEDNIFVVHRVVDKNNETGVIITKGDNNPIEDPLEITKEKNMVYGKYLTTLGFMAIFSGGINQNLIFFILIIIFVIMLGMQIFSMFIKGKTEKLKEDKEAKKALLREELKRQILEEELAKLKAANEEKDKTTEENEE